MIVTKNTAVNDALLLKMSAQSESPFYRMQMDEVVTVFNRQHQTKKGLNVLMKRAILAGDVTMVRSGSGKFVLWLTKELNLLEERNERVREHNRKVRREQNEAKRQFMASIQSEMEAASAARN